MLPRFFNQSHEHRSRLLLPLSQHLLAGGRNHDKFVCGYLFRLRLLLWSPTVAPVLDDRRMDMVDNIRAGDSQKIKGALLKEDKYYYTGGFLIQKVMLLFFHE